MSSTDTTAPSPPAGSAIARIPGTFFSPVRTLESIARRPTWIAPLVLWTAVSIAFTALLGSRMDYGPAIREQLEKRNVPQERWDAIVESQSKFAATFGYAIGALAPAIVVLIVAAVYLGAFKAFGWDLRFKQSLGVTSHAFLPSVLGTLLALPVAFQRDRIDPRGLGDLVRSNLGFLVSREEAPALYSLLSSIDVFSFWVMALLVLGFSASARVSRGRAAGIVVTLWALYVLGKTGWAAAFS